MVDDDRMTIGDVAERSGLAPSALRFYEAEGLISADRTSGGQRRFERSVLRRLGVIKTAQRIGIPLEEIREALAALPAERTPTARDWTRLSTRWRSQLDDRIAALEALRDQLDACIGCGCLSLQTCRLYNPEDVAAVRGAGPRYLLGDRRAEVRAEGARTRR